MHAHINAVQAPHRSSTHTPGWVLPVKVAWLAREHSQWERYRHARRLNASLTDEDGMKATLAESTIKSAEGLEKGAREPTSQTVKPRAAPRRSEIRPLHMPRESKWYTTWPFKWGLNSEYLRYSRGKFRPRAPMSPRVIRYVGEANAAMRGLLIRGECIPLYGMNSPKQESGVTITDFRYTSTCKRKLIFHYWK